MGKYVLFCTSGLLFSLSLCVNAHEADPDDVLGGKISTWVEFATDYVFRGESETNDGEIPSLKASVTWSHDTGVYLGLYSANNLFPTYCRGKKELRTNCDAVGKEETNTRINAIIGPYAGWSGNLFNTGFSLNSMLFSYHYPGDGESNYLELFNTLTLPSIQRWEEFSLKLEYSPTLNEWFGTTDVYSQYFAIHPSVSLPMDFTLSGSYGWQIFTGDGAKPDAQGFDPDWKHWTIAISRPVLGWMLNLSYHDTDIEIGKNAGYYDGPNNNIVDGRTVFAISKTF